MFAAAASAVLAARAAWRRRRAATPPRRGRAAQGTTTDATARSPPPATWSHAYVAFGGAPKYPRGFKHFDCVNPDAPKGGTLYLGNPDRRTSFDKFNPYTLKGNSPTGVRDPHVRDARRCARATSPATMYGLVAEEMLVAPDKSSITFRLNPKARFNNGDPVTAADVKHSFDMLIEQGRGTRRSARSSTACKARSCWTSARSASTSRIAPTTRSSTSTRLPVFSRKWGAGPDGKPKPFDQVINEYPITSGPYTIDGTDSGRGIEFKRNPDYWARDLGVRRGQFNFDRVVYRLYRDRAISMEAFKAGEFDLMQEFVASQYVRQHDGAKWRDGRIVKKMFEYGMGQGHQAYLLNLRRPLFQDRRVREALDYTYDFEKINLYSHAQARVQPVLELRLRGEGPAGPGELALLEPFRERAAAGGVRPAVRSRRAPTPAPTRCART